jgi:hypothetical protein
MNSLQQKVIVDTELVLSDQVHNYLGPDLVLQRCRVLLRTNSKALTVTEVQFIDCQIEATRKLSNFQMWCSAVIKGCKFSGKFVGNDFGNWHEQHAKGSIANCDFSNAVLDGCRFMDCEIDSIKLPKWPCAAILYPQKQSGRVVSVDWPGKLRLWAQDLVNQPNVTAALVEYAPTLARQFGCTEEELREALRRLENVLM